MRSPDSFPVGRLARSGCSGGSLLLARRGSLASVRRIITVMIAVFAGGAAWLLWLVGNPPETLDPSGDAIFVHAGGNGERIRAGMELFDRGVAPVLVFSDPEPGSVPPGLCSAGAAVMCLVPDPPDTAGEAIDLGRLIREQSWDEVVVVTSDYHLRRAVMLDRSCTDAEILPIPAHSSRAEGPVTDVEVQEAIALAAGWIFQRCR